MESTLRRTWAEIDLDALAHNYRTLRAHVGPAVGLFWGGEFFYISFAPKRVNEPPKCLS